MLQGIFERVKTVIQDNTERNGVSEIDITRLDAAGNQSKTLNIFIHGYSALKDDLSKSKLVAKLAIDRSSDNWLFCWPSGFAVHPVLKDIKPSDLLLLYRGTMLTRGLFLGLQVTKMFSHFKDHLIEAERIGRNHFFDRVIQEIKKSGKNYEHINIIGHSLGARLLCNALIHVPPEGLSGLNIKNIYFLAGAAPLDFDWSVITSKIDGSIYNFYSKTDFVLVFKPDNEKCIGRYEIKGADKAYARIKNFETSIMHWKYWDSIHRVFDMTK